MNYYYMKIAERVFRLETEESFEIDSSVKHFFVEDGSTACRETCYRIYVEKELEQVTGEILFRDANRVILECNSKECRVYLVPGYGIPYAYYQELANGSCEIHILEQVVQERRITIRFIELLALEKYLMKEDALVLHSSYIIHDGKAVLFSAPSGTGKSTQAELWKKYKGAKIINGDRSIFRLEGEEVQVHGIPFCGSSAINRNESAPLVGIVFLKQDADNSIRRFSEAEAMKKIYSQCSVNYWNTEQMDQAFQIIEELVKRIPVYELKCTISQEAVELVHKNLFFV